MTTGTTVSKPESPRRIDVQRSVQAWESLLRAQVTLMRRFVADDVWADVSMREYDVLFTLASHGGMRLNELNEEILLTQPSLSRLVDRLVTRGYVAKGAVPNDRRGSWITLTAAGEAVQKEIGRAHATRIARYVGEALDAEELRELERLTNKLRLAQRQIATRTNERAARTSHGAQPSNARS